MLPCRPVFQPEQQVRKANAQGANRPGRQGQLAAPVKHLENQLDKAAGEERQAAASTLWEQVTQVAPMVPLVFKNGSLLTQWGQVRGMAPTQRDVFFGLEGWQIRRSRRNSMPPWCAADPPGQNPQ